MKGIKKMEPNDTEDEQDGRDIYYSNNEKEKYRSVHPPSNRVENSFLPNEKTTGLNCDRQVKRESDFAFETAFENFGGKNVTDDIDRFTDESILNDSKGSYFDLASPDDCYDRSDSSVYDNPYCSPSPVSLYRISTENMKVYAYCSDLLPDIPAFLSTSHFTIQQGYKWTETEALINQFFVTFDPRFIWEYKKTEFLWFCSSVHTNCTHYCTFQIRAFLANFGEVVIEMQKLDGDSSVFSGFYHALKDILLLSTSYSTPLVKLSSKMPTEMNSQTQSESSNGSITEITDFEVLLLPVLDMMRSEYPCMQMEALKMACELSADAEKDLSVNVVISNLESECTRRQMIQLGYLNVLLEMICKCYTVAHEIVINGFPLMGHRALKLILNLSKGDSCEKYLTDNIHFRQFQAVVGFISDFSIPCYVQSLQLQAICIELSANLKQ